MAAEWTASVCDVPFTAGPDAKRIPPGVAASALPVVERNGFIFVWWDAEGAEPWFDVPAIPEASSNDWSTPERYE
jgi:phenylpropionate dioxygenase-like ring-hydroxylating dioxygenase large terminal subunit